MQRQMIELQKNKGVEELKERVYSKISIFISSFKKKMNRTPLRNEIKDNLSDIDPNDIDMYFIDNV